MNRLYANTTSFCIRDFSIHRFWYLAGVGGVVLEPIPPQIPRNTYTATLLVSLGRDIEKILFTHIEQVILSRSLGKNFLKGNNSAIRIKSLKNVFLKIHRYLKNEECSCSAIHNKNLNQSRNK